MFRCLNSFRGWIALGIAMALIGFLAIWHSAHAVTAFLYLVLLTYPLVDTFLLGGFGRSKLVPVPARSRPRGLPTQSSFPGDKP